MNDFKSALMTFGFIVATFFILFAFAANQETMALITTTFVA